jgi:replicative DNA helicase
MVALGKDTRRDGGCPRSLVFGDRGGAAHTVILPYRPLNVETGAFTGEDELIIGKQRWGAIGSVPVSLNGQYLRFDAR